MSWLLLPLAVASSGLAAGGLMIASLGGAPLLLRLSWDQYVPIHQFLVTRFDPFMPICMITALVCDLLLVFLAPGTAARAIVAVAVLLLAAAIYVSLRKNVPINRWVAALEPGTPPPGDAGDPRVRWRNWNALRTGFGVAALGCNAVAVAVVLGGA